MKLSPDDIRRHEEMRRLRIQEIEKAKAVLNLSNYKIRITRGEGGKLEGAIYNLTESQAAAVAALINDAPPPWSTYPTTHQQAHATVSEMVAPPVPRVVGISSEADRFLKKYLDEVVGENCEFPETK